MYFKSLDDTEGFFPLSENFHENGILKKTSAPAYLDSKIELDLKTKAKRLAQNLNFYGVLAFELFELLDGRIVFNEIAPRPHNSFHWTIEGCKTSQFQQLIRSLSGLPFGDISVIGRWHMRNILGHSKEELKRGYKSAGTVSYTHLTLPTSYAV